MSPSQSTPTSVSPAEAIARFLGIVGRLKTTPRQGWLDRGIASKSVESVADHTFRVAMLAWVASYAVPTLDRNRVLILAMLHDLAEAVTGDLTPYAPEQVDVAGRGERTAFLNQRHLPAPDRTAVKRAAENAAISEMISGLPEAIKTEIAALWQELDEKSTPEARFVKQADELETYLQSLEYKAEHPELPVDSFAAEVSDVIDLPSLIELREAIRFTGERNPEPN